MSQPDDTLLKYYKALSVRVINVAMIFDFTATVIALTPNILGILVINHGHINDLYQLELQK